MATPILPDLGTSTRSSGVVIVRPRGQAKCILREIEEQGSGFRVVVLSPSKDADWEEIANKLESFFKFPKGAKHALAALSDQLEDLSWLPPLNYNVVYDTSTIQDSNMLPFYALDALSRAVQFHDYEGGARFNLIIIV
ncbi:hypothetical protein [Sphingosinicella sp. BN140058]|uniref:hypothetical protein n=1 Tax=Sphingosinicella sp. BN140058 TaxID=1892855 RepID=UPI0010112EA0|nr:hypothetical protein [Sphingosinicella sp. BN140058]QAY77166.1 hypothetical protein ETR14_12145 [Sphingosinicella sp. BN140058]